MRICPFNDCGRRIPDDRFACGPHWYSLDKYEQARIWESYRQWQRGGISGDELRTVQQDVLADRGKA